MQILDDLNDLRFIAAISETGSLTGAAKRLGVNHATVFRRVLQSEKRIGVRLFERSGGRYTPTPAGEELARAGAQIELAAAESLRKVAGRDLRPSGVVRITTTDSVAHYLLNPILHLCRKQYPDITLQVAVASEMANLSKRDADIAIRPATQPPEHLIGKLIAPLSFAVYGAASYLELTGQRAWGEHQWIVLDESHSQNLSLKWLAQWIDIKQAGLSLNSFGGIAQACMDGLGLAVLPCFIGSTAPQLQRLSAPLPEAASELWLLTHPDLRDTVRIKAVFQVLLYELKSKTHLLNG
jgi:DNA-binding transcriptional LysR family regulator